MKSAGASPCILIIDDEQQMLQLLGPLFRREGFEVIEATNGHTALDCIRRSSPDLILLDLLLPDMDGLSVLKEVRKIDLLVPLILMTGNGTIESAVEALKYGAFDYITKPCRLDALKSTVQRALACRIYAQPVDGEASLPELMGSSPAIRRILAAIEVVAPTDFTVIIHGETGAGKELVAKSIHRLGNRAAGPFVPVDCGSLPLTLIESELFGHEKGAFTGADRAHPGKFEVAAGGTLFLDEVQNLPAPVQTKLLRALQERQICRVGGSKPLDLDVRVAAASNENLAVLVETGSFRRDLYYRLNEFTISIPPLRERPEDIHYLSNRFLCLTCKELGKGLYGISDDAAALLRAYPWPGNVRELRNVIRRAALLATEQIEPAHLGLPALPAPDELSSHFTSLHLDTPTSLKELVRRSVVEAERHILVQVLRQTSGNMAKAARILQVDYKTIRTKTKQYGIHIP